MRFAPLSSLKIKFAILIVGLLGASFLLLSYILITQALTESKNTIQSSAEAFAKLSVKTLGNYYNLYYQSGYPRYVSLTQDVLKLQPNITQARIISLPDGHILADSVQDQPDRSSPPTLDDHISNHAILDKLANDDQYQAIAPGQTYITQLVVPYEGDFGSRPFAIEYTIDYSSAEQDAIQAIGLILIITLSIGLISIVAIYWLVGRTLLNPIDSLIDYAQAVSRGNFDASVKVKTNDELETLAKAVNNMSHKLSQNIIELQQLDASKNEFIMIASHNLRTPLTTLKGYLPILSASPQPSPAARRQTVQAMSEGLGQLSHLVEELISVVTLRQSNPVALQPISLKEAVTQAVDRLQPQIQAKHITLSLDISNLLIISADNSLVTKAIEHVVENAIKFSSDKGQIRLHASRVKQKIELVVEDDGIGMTPEQQTRVFQMFQRGTSILNYDYQGIGLGLYITRLILEKFQAILVFKSKSGQGTKVSLVFPLPDQKINFDL